MTNCKAADNHLLRPALPDTPELLDIVAPAARQPFLWIDGHTAGNNSWQTLGFRELDKNRWPTDVRDLSPSRTWFVEADDTDSQMFTPKKLPVRLEMPADFCAAGSVQVLLLTGFITSGPISPQIVFGMNRTTEVFHWDFRAATATTPQEYSVWAMEAKTNKTSSTVTLSEMDVVDPKNPQNFNLTVSCADYNGTGSASSQLFKVVMNYWDPTGDPHGLARASSAWDVDAPTYSVLAPADVTFVDVLGSMELDYVGFTTPGCLAVAPNGRVVELAGQECDQPRDAVCEHQSCYTHEGDECIFPFEYKGVEYTQCATEDVYLPWCVTGNRY